jgi:hypothetical protein
MAQLTWLCKTLVIATAPDRHESPAGFSELPPDRKKSIDFHDTFTTI